MLHGLQIVGQTANFAASGQVVGQRQIAFGDVRNAICRALQRIWSQQRKSVLFIT
jgi:hypothetical protein